MPHFPNANPELSSRYRNKATHGGNRTPSAADWVKNDDTLDRLAASSTNPDAQEIGKGIASTWVVAFLNGVPETTDPALYEDYYTDFLRYQATMVQDFGEHIDSHVARFEKLGMPTGIKQIKQFDAARLAEADVAATGRWACYISVGRHGIACGGTLGTDARLYINEPDTGLLGYDGKAGFFPDLDDCISGRRAKEHLPPTDAARFWMYQPG